MCEWRTFDTAPRDDSEFLAFGSYVYPGDDSPTIYYAIVSFENTRRWGPRWTDGESYYAAHQFSHWMPLIPPKKEK